MIVIKSKANIQKVNTLKDLHQDKNLCLKYLTTQVIKKLNVSIQDQITNQGMTTVPLKRLLIKPKILLLVYLKK